MKNMTFQFASQEKNDTVDKEDKSRENMNEKVNAFITSTKNNIDMVNKTEKEKRKKRVVTSKNKKNYTVDKA